MQFKLKKTADNQYTLTMAGMTGGKLLALVHALEARDTVFSREMVEPLKAIMEDV